MCIQFYRQKHDKSRFWELFIPTTNNFQFWLASSAFAFFAYQSLYKSDVVGVWGMLVHNLIAYAFAGLGFILIGGLAYLFLAWIIGFGIRRIKKGNRDGKST